jgi:hypothetical protein
MTRPSASIGVAIVSGALAAFLLPPPWLAPLSAAAVISCLIFAVIVRVTTKTEPPSSPVAGILLSAANLPEQPLAEVKEGWALSMFFASAAFLVSMGFVVMALANA